MTVITDGSLCVVWPASAPWWDVRLLDTESGRDYSREVLTLTVSVEPRGEMWAEMLMLTDEFGRIASAGAQVLLDPSGGYRRDVFRFRVAEMRVAADRS